MNWAILADDATGGIEIPHVLDQLPNQAWDFGPLFIIAIVVILLGFGVLIWVLKVLIGLLKDMLTTIKAHLVKNENADNSLVSTLTEVRLLLQHRKNGGGDDSVPPVIPTPLPVVVQPPGSVP